MLELDKESYTTHIHVTKYDFPLMFCQFQM